MRVAAEDSGFPQKSRRADGSFGDRATMRPIQPRDVVGGVDLNVAQPHGPQRLSRDRGVIKLCDPAGTRRAQAGEPYGGARGQARRGHFDVGFSPVKKGPTAEPCPRRSR